MINTSQAVWAVGNSTKPLVRGKKTQFVQTSEVQVRGAREGARCVRLGRHRRDIFNSVLCTSARGRASQGDVRRL